MVVMTSIAMTSSSPQNLPMLFVVGLGAYCFGGIFLDPLSAWVSSVNVVLALYVIARSQEVARIAHDHPWITVAVFLGIGAASCFRLFARSTFRRKPLRATSLLPGRFSLEKSGEFERKRRIHDGPRRTGWRAGYLGSDPWRWVRAAVHEAYGSLGLKSLSRAIGRAWGLGLLLLIYAWADKGEMSFGEALAKSIYDALFRSPHVPEFGEEGGPYFVVALAIAAAGVVTVLYRPVALNRVIAYPLSRSQRTRVHFRGGLVDGAIFLFIVGPCLFAIGLLTGWVVGYEPRFDFMPFFLRVLMITVILMPLAHVGRLQLQAATRRRAEHHLPRDLRLADRRAGHPVRRAPDFAATLPPQADDALPNRRPGLTLSARAIPRRLPSSGAPSCVVH
jgi:hypothetical protein